MRILSAILGIALLASIALPQNNSALVRGIVVRLDTGAPIAETTVGLISESDNRVVAKASSDSNGRFEFRNVAPGSYQVQAQRTGFFGPISHEVSRNVVSTKVTAIAQQASEVSLGMVPGGAIAGRIVNTRGVPAVGAIVKARTAVYRSGILTLVDITQAKTDENGRYRLFDFGLGKFYIQAEARPEPGAPIDTGTYYPNSSDFETAEPILLQPGTELSSIDIQLRQSQTVPVRVRVVDENGKPIAANVDPLSLDRLMPNAAPLILVITNVTSPASAQQLDQIHNVRPGSYELVARTSPPAAIQQGRVPLRVGGNAPVEITVVVRPPVDVSAKVVTGNTPLDTKILQFQLEQRERAGYRKSAAPDSNFAGMIKFKDVPEGKAVARILGLPSGNYIADVRQDGRSVFNDGLISVGQQAVSIEWEVRGGGGSVEGTVQGAPVGRIADSRVVLVPESPRRSNPLLYQVTNPDATGRFALQGIAPGDYRIFAWESIPDGAWENAEYLAPFERFGRVMKITSGVSVIAAVDWIPKTPSNSPTSSVPSAPAIPVADANGRAIEGTVTNAANGKPIGGARVLIFPATPVRTTTDENGRFLLTGIPEGKFDVVVQHDAYLGPLTNGSYSSGATQSITVDGRKPRVNLDFILYPSGTVSGRILDQNGKLASRLVVDLVNLTTPSRNGRARTDDRGEFHVAGLVPGQYLVAVQQELGIPSAASQSSVVRTYYPGAIDSSRALPVTISLGSDIRNLDFQIQTASTVSISGKIATDLTGVELPPGLHIGLNVAAISNDTNAANPNPVHIGSVDQKTGEFEVRGLQPGSYTVLSRIQAPGISLAGMANVDVGIQDVGGVQLLVRRGMDLRVKIVGGAIGSVVTHQLMLRPRLSPSGLNSITSASPDSSLLVLPNVFSGTYDLFHLNIIGGECIRDIMQGGRSVLQNGITIGQNSADSIELVLETRRQAIPRVPGEIGLPRCPTP